MESADQVYLRENRVASEIGGEILNMGDGVSVKDGVDV